MKIQTIALSAIAAMLLIGCSEQSSLNSPVTSVPIHQQATAKAIAPARIHASAGFNIDQVVIDQETGDAYSVTGTIAFDYSNDQGNYTFATHPSLTIVNTEGGKGYQSAIETKTSDDGKEDGEIAVVKEYKLPGLPSGSFLRVEFHMTDIVSLQSVAIVVGTLEVESEGR